MHWIEYLAEKLSYGIIALWANWFPDMRTVIQDQPPQWQMTLDRIDEEVEEAPPPRPPSCIPRKDDDYVLCTVIDSDDDVGEYGYESDIEDGQ